MKIEFDTQWNKENYFDILSLIVTKYNLIDNREYISLSLHLLGLGISLETIVKR
jgi:hypothetical protein